jgi:hypothetical protein
MRTSILRHLPAAAGLALVCMTVAACGSAPAQSLPIQPPSPSAAPSVAPSATPGATPASPSTKPVHIPKPTDTNHGPPCRGAVVHRINAADTGPAWPRLCITVGGVLRVENLGPEGFAQSPPGKAECEYEGGVRICRLIATGTVRFTTDHGGNVRRLTVDIVRASSGPSPACANAGTTRTIDANDGGPPWSAACMKLGAVLRVENLGPGLLTVTPSNLVSCVYEAGIHQCRLVREGTFTAQTNGSGGIRAITVVAIR